MSRYCDCEDYPCCGHTDNDDSSPMADMTDQEIKEAVWARMDADPDYDYYEDYR